MITPQLNAERYKIEDLLNFVRSGKIRIPRFQRGLRWTLSDNTLLLDSIYRNYPIGTLLFWERGADAAKMIFGPIEIEAPQSTNALWVVDGQQRITSLAGSLIPTKQGASQGEFDIVFDLETTQFSRRHGPSDTQIPVREAYDLQRVLAWVRERDLPQELQPAAFKLADRLRNYEIPAYKVTTDSEQVLQVIFDRTNSSGKRMTKGEVFGALNTSESRSEADMGALEARIEGLGFGKPLAGNTLSYCVLAVQGPDVFRDFRREFSSEKLQAAAMAATFDAFSRVRDFLAEDADVPHFQLVAYQHQLVGLVRFFALHPNPKPFVRVLLRRWYWQAAEVGPLPKRGNTGTLKATLLACQEGDPYRSASQLLELTKQTFSEFQVGDSYRWTEAGTRVAVCALAELGPRRITDGGRIDVTYTIEQLRREALIAIVEPEQAGGRSLANRLFSDVDEVRDVVRDALVNADPAVASSLGVPDEILELLRQDQDAEFLRLREIYIAATVRRFLDARMERERPVREPIARAGE